MFASNKTAKEAQLVALVEIRTYYYVRWNRSMKLTHEVDANLNMDSLSNTNVMNAPDFDRATAQIT